MTKSGSVHKHSSPTSISVPLVTCYLTQLRSTLPERSRISHARRGTTPGSALATKPKPFTKEHFRCHVCESADHPMLCCKKCKYPILMLAIGG